MKTVEKKDIMELSGDWIYDDIVEAFGDFTENGEDSVCVGKSHNTGYAGQ